MDHFAFGVFSVAGFSQNSVRSIILLIFRIFTAMSGYMLDPYVELHTS